MHDWRTCASAAVLAASCSFAPGAQADALSYEVTLNVLSATYPTYPDGMSCEQAVGSSPAPTFGCGWGSGGSASGSFRLQTGPAPLADGIHSYVPLDAWVMRIGGVEWDMHRPDSDFAGFRDGAYCGAAGSGYSQINPGLISSGGSITGFCGGVYGSADVPFVDFDYAAGTGNFYALDAGGIRLSGHYTIKLVPAPVGAVPEPASPLLAALGIVLVGCARRWAR